MKTCMHLHILPVIILVNFWFFGVPVDVPFGVASNRDAEVVSVLLPDEPARVHRVNLPQQAEKSTLKQHNQTSENKGEALKHSR